MKLLLLLLLLLLFDFHCLTFAEFKKIIIT